MNQDNLHDLRTDYQNEQLEINQLESDPMKQFRLWFQEALDQGVAEPNAFSLATVNSASEPSNRIVLVKEIRDEGIVFFSNYESRKGLDISKNNHVSACFFWQPLSKQVRIFGICEKIKPKDSDKYFKSRPFDSQIGAIASPQSQIIESREWLISRFEKCQSKLDEHVQRPDFWGGYIIKPLKVEFWQGQPSRLHDRFLYQWVDEEWTIDRLAP